MRSLLLLTSLLRLLLLRPFFLCVHSSVLSSCPGNGPAFFCRLHLSQRPLHDDCVAAPAAAAAELDWAAATAGESERALASDCRRRPRSHSALSNSSHSRIFVVCACPSPTLALSVDLVVSALGSTLPLPNCCLCIRASTLPLSQTRTGAACRQLFGNALALSAELLLVHSGPLTPIALSVALLLFFCIRLHSLSLRHERERSLHSRARFHSSTGTACRLTFTLTLFLSPSQAVVVVFLFSVFSFCISLALNLICTKCNGN